MKRLIFAIACCAALFAQHSTKPKPAPKAQIEKPRHDPEDRWICRLGSYHDCHCPAMMAEAQEDGVKHCADTSTTREAYIKCLSTLPSNCDTIQKADTKHPEHSCKRTCKAIAGCQCDDGPVCKGPLVYQNSADPSDEVRQ